MHIKKWICSSWNLKKVYVFGIYLQVFDSILYVLCQYMHVLHVFARINATSAFVQYMQILITIHAYWYIKHIPIYQIVFAWYDSICMYLLTAGCWTDWKTMFMVSICMYIHIYACELTVYYSMTANSAAQLPETVLQWTICLQEHTGTQVLAKKGM